MSALLHEVLRPLRLELRSALALVVRLQRSIPGDALAPERASLDEVLAVRDRVRRIVKARHRVSRSKLRDSGDQLTAAWGIFQGQVTSWLRVGGTDEAEWAAQIVAAVLPDGLTFVTLPYESLCVESNELLERIDEEKLEELLARLIHPRIMPVLREKHAALAEKLGLGVGTIDTTHEAMLSEALRDLSLAITQYGIVLASSIKPHDSASEQRVLAALAPVRAYREAHAPGRVDTEDEVLVDEEDPIVEEPTNPGTPPVTGEPPPITA